MARNGVNWPDLAFMQDATQPVASRRNPRGFHPAKVDSAGRLKVPAKCLEYLQMLEEKTFFVTLMAGLPRIYTNGSWERNLAKLDGDPALKYEIAWYADTYGEDVEMDQQARSTLPLELRKELGLESQSVQLRFYEDVLTIYPQGDYSAKSEEIKSGMPANLERAKSFGFIV